LLKISRRRQIALLSIGITLAILAVFISRLDWEEFISAVHRVEASWLVLTCCTIFLSVSLRAIRWKIASTWPNSRLTVFWYATVLGYVGNMVYPARAGEAIRIVALCQSTQMPAGRAIASAFADRLADVFMLGAVAILVLSSQQIASGDAKVGTISVLFAAVPILCFIGFVRWGYRFRGAVQQVAAKLPKPMAERIPNWYEQAVAQAMVIHKPRTLTAVLGLAVLAASSDYLAIWFGMRAMGWSLPAVAAVLVGIFIAMGAMIPATPGNIGIYQVACVVGLGFYGISEASALAFSIVLQITILGVIAIQGVAALAYYGRSIQIRFEHLGAPKSAPAQDDNPQTADER